MLSLSLSHSMELSLLNPVARTLQSLCALDIGPEELLP
jgi:hypothetical protein